MAKKQNYKNYNLMGRISPSVIDTKTSSGNVLMDELYHKTLTVNKFPIQMHYAWLSKISRLKNVSVSLINVPQSAATVTNYLDKSYQNTVKESEGAENASVEESTMALGQAIRKEIYEDNRKVFLSTLTLTVTGSTVEELNENIDVVKSELAMIGCIPIEPKHLQEEGLKMTLPYCMPNPTIDLMANQFFMSTALAGSFMYDAAILKDDAGTILGKDAYSNISIMDLWKRDSKTARNNSNMIITGASGVGKTSLLSTILLNEYGEGTKILIIDPKRDYKKMTEEVGGQWLNMAGGYNKINYFQIKSNGLEEDVNPLDEHIRSLRVLLKNYLTDFTDTELAYVEKLLVEKYAEIGITKETDFSTKTEDDYFIAEDFYDFIVSKQMYMQNIKSGTVQPKDGEYYTEMDIDRIKKIEIGLYKMAKGADSSILNGKTTIKLNSDFICFDIMDLQNVDQGLRRTQYFNILSMAFTELFKSKTERVILVLDEAHMLLDKNNLETVETLTKISKRVRSYSSSIVLATQEVKDFLHPGIVDAASGLLNNATYKMFMGCDGVELNAVKTIFKLTSKEENILSLRERGVALIEAGNKRLKIEIALPKWVEELIA